MNLSRRDAVTMFEELGFALASEWSQTKMLGKIKSLPDIPEIDKMRKKIKSKVLCGKLIAAVENDEEINFKKLKGKNNMSKKKKASKKKTKKTTGSKTKSLKKKGKKKGSNKKAGTTTVERDVLGSQKGTLSAKVNAVFLKNPTKKYTMADLVKITSLKTGQVNTCLYRLTILINKVKKTGKHYQLVNKGKRKS